MGHNNSQQCINFLTTVSQKRNWKDVKIQVFDLPKATDEPYGKRLEALQDSKLTIC
jgi:hypothetical protein